jgi:succinylglutamate desuccinylase
VNGMERETLRGEREIGHAGGYAPGATLVCVAGLHGNEPAGARALKRVFDRLVEERLSVRGEFAALRGNVAAARTDARQIDEDMNRVWGGERMDRVAAGEDLGTSEAREQRELLQELDRILSHATGRVILLDFHTASSDSAPFIVLDDSLRNREFARRFPLPVVLGMEEYIFGTLTEHVSGRGHTAIAVEGGRHGDPASVDRLESFAWLALVLAGCLEEKQVPDLDLHRERLRRSAEGIDAVMEIIHRHDARTDFEMKPGYRNFQPVRAREGVATEEGKDVPMPRGGRIFLPRYQPVGEDGFFLARRVNPFWLGLSAWLRRTAVPRWVMHFPGVQRHPSLRNAVQVEGALARRLTRKVFHLLGFRVISPERGRMIMERRRESGPGED